MGEHQRDRYCRVGGAAGDIVIPVYIGGDMIDEIVVTAQQRMNLRSGGRSDGSFAVSCF